MVHLKQNLFSGAQFSDERSKGRIHSKIVFPNLPHSHLCESCGNCWCHVRRTSQEVSSKEYDALHHCPRCGQEQYWVNRFIHPIRYVELGLKDQDKISPYLGQERPYKDTGSHNDRS